MKDYKTTRCVYVDFEICAFVGSWTTCNNPILFNGAYNNPLKFSTKLKDKVASEYKPLFEIMENL